jgi:hypothetical protein
MQADQKADLAARRPRQDLAQRHDAAVLLAGQPPALLHVSALEITQVGNRAPERRQPQLQ